MPLLEFSGLPKAETGQSMKRTGHVGWEYVQVIHGKEKYVLKVKSMILMHINNEHRSKILFNSLITEKISISTISRRMKKKQTNI